MPYPVVFTPEAEEQLVALYRYIAVASSTEIAFIPFSKLAIAHSGHIYATTRHVNDFLRA